MRRSDGSRTRSLAAVAAAVVLTAGTLYALGERTQPAQRNALHTARTALVPHDRALAAVMRVPHILFRNTEPGRDFGRVEVVPIANPRGPRTPTPLSCARVDMAGGYGVCGTTHVGGLSAYGAQIFDASFTVRASFPLQGLPNRVRVAPDGRWASITEFVYGDSYAAPNFSTRAEFIRLPSGVDIGNLEAFTVTDAGAVVGAINRNYWGVTFAKDSNRFYATQAVGADIRLIEGRVSTRDARTLAANVECPSLSPDQTRIAYKQRIRSGATTTGWRLHVLDVRTGADHALAETRSVDDQVEWLDNHTVIYAIPRPHSAVTDVWSVPSDGTGTPSILIPGAFSPSVSRAT